MERLHTAVLLVNSVQAVDNTITREVVVQTACHVVTLALEVVRRTRDVLTGVTHAVQSPVLANTTRKTPYNIFSMKPPYMKPLVNVAKIFSKKGGAYHRWQSRYSVVPGG